MKLLRNLDPTYLLGAVGVLMDDIIVVVVHVSLLGRLGIALLPLFWHS